MGTDMDKLNIIRGESHSQPPLTHPHTPTPYSPPLHSFSFEDPADSPPYARLPSTAVFVSRTCAAAPADRPCCCSAVAAQSGLS